MGNAVTKNWKAAAPAARPPEIDLQSLYAGIHWHQRWELFKGVVTPGRNDVRKLCDLAGVPPDLRGQRVLDIGAWNGCFSFECERRGAAEVVALTLEDPAATGLPKLAQALDSRVVRNVDGSVYDLDRRQLGEFDLILFFGVLYHLRYPVLAIDKIRTVARGTVLVETHVIDNYWMAGRKSGCPLHTLESVNPQLMNTPIWRFYHHGELLGDKSNIFGPNVQAVLEAFESAGFAIEPLKRWGDRCSFRAVPQQALDEAMASTYEIMGPANRKLLNFDVPAEIKQPEPVHQGVPAEIKQPERLHQGAPETKQREGVFSRAWLRRVFRQRC
jgi:tRNA (mo5U34)-methyltransferase